MKVAVYRKAHFNAAHRLHNDAWDDEMSRKIFLNSQFVWYFFEIELVTTLSKLACEYAENQSIEYISVHGI